MTGPIRAAWIWWLVIAAGAAAAVDVTAVAIAIVRSLERMWPHH